VHLPPDWRLIGRQTRANPAGLTEIKPAMPGIGYLASRQRH
jgi:hypothetical protein